jgi:diguanylate cyclase (GGDEF)-like protein
MAAHLLERLKNTVISSDEGVDVLLSASFGVAAYPEDATGRKELIAAADAAMYEAKRAGRGVVKVFGE